MVVGFAHEGTMNSFRQTIGYLMLAFLMIAMAYVAVANFKNCRFVYLLVRANR